jgi:dimethylamine/trimethylamine dehydrogenase
MDSVVIVTQRVSTDALYPALKNDPGLADAGIESVYRAGDCVVPRVLADAIFDGHRLAREIDSANPERPLPFIREGRFVGVADDQYDTILHRDVPTAALAAGLDGDPGLSRAS